VFFSVGTAVLAATLLCNTLLDYFYQQGILKQAEKSVDKLNTLNADYDTLLGQLEGDPCQIARLAPATLGIEPNEPNTAYPRATVDKLAAARRALSEEQRSPSFWGEEPNQTAQQDLTPKWLVSCCQRPRWHILFISGCALILIAFVFFGPSRHPSRSMTVTSKTETKPPEA